MANNVPTLDTNGWLSDVQNKVTIIFLDYLATSKSQSDIHRDTIRSFPFTIAANPRDTRALRAGIIDDLTSLYSAYTDGVTVNVEIKDLDESKAGAFLNIVIDVRIQDGIETVSIGRYITIKNGKISNISIT